MKQKLLSVAIHSVVSAAVLSAGMSLTSCETNSQAEISILPVPAELTVTSGTFTLKDGMTIGIQNDSLRPAAQYLAEIIKPATGYNLAITDGSGSITLMIGDVAGNQGAYTLKSTRKGIEITGNSYGGVIAGIESLRQLLPAQIESKTIADDVKWKVPGVEITDSPTFAWRGIMLDVSRHFYTTDEVKELLDLMASYKLNKFHWHLSDDQGWRIEIKKYPLLTELGAWRKFNFMDEECARRAIADQNPDYAIPTDKLRITETGDTLYGGFYTQDEIRDIIDYAAVRGIDIIPEIDMPGHMSTAVSIYSGVACTKDISPVCPGKESALEFCKNVYDELTDLFPYEYVHIGGDEVDKTYWKKCKDCQKRMADNNLKTEEELQSWFIHQMEAFINSKGKKMIGWDEILEGGLSKTATVMWWRAAGTETPAKVAAQGNNLIYTPTSHFYLDYPESDYTAFNIINFDFNESLPADKQDAILGVQGNIWCEWIPSRERMQYQAVTRMLAIAELGWAQPDKRDVEAFRTRLAAQFNRLNIRDINYRIPAIEGFNDVNEFSDSTMLDITCFDPTVQIRYTTDGTRPTTESELYTAPVPVTESTDFTLATFRQSGKRGDIVSTRFEKK